MIVSESEVHLCNETTVTAFSKSHSRDFWKEINKVCRGLKPHTVSPTVGTCGDPLSISNILGARFAET